MGSHAPSLRWGEFHLVQGLLTLTERFDGAGEVDRSSHPILTLSQTTHPRQSPTDGVAKG